jgi:hypothetical protein
MGMSFVGVVKQLSPLIEELIRVLTRIVTSSKEVYGASFF